MNDTTTSIPPVRKQVDVRCPADHAFDKFTARIAEWWPLERHSVGGSDAHQLAFEPRVDGRLFETTVDGKEHLWGTVTRWDPPRTVAFTWHPGREAALGQLVEVTFSPIEGGTRVELVHSGWESLGPAAEATRSGYDTGWVGVLEVFAKSCAEE